MRYVTPAVLSFSLLAFAGAASAQATKSQEQQSQPSQQTQQSQAPKDKGKPDVLIVDKDKRGDSEAVLIERDKQAQKKDQGKDRQAAQGEQNQSASAGASGQSSGEIMASKLMDAKVVDSQGKDLGEISEVVVDLTKDRVHAVVLEFGGFMGVGGKQFAFPMSELKPGKAQNQFVANIDKQKLENAEGFAKGKMPGMNDDYWSRVSGGGQQASSGAQQQQKAGQKAQAGGGQGQKFNLVQASKMMGAEVQDKSGKPIGEIRDVIIGTSDGAIKDLIINVKDAGEARVPAKGLSSGTDDRLVLDMADDQVRAQAKKTDRRAERDTGAATGATKGTTK